MSPSYGRAAATALKGFRAHSGNTITFNGIAAACTTGAVSGDDLKFLPDGVRNAANSDSRVFALTPSVGLTLAATPEALETQQVTWNVNGESYTIEKGYQTAIGTTWRLIAYRVPVVGTSTTNPTNSNGSWGP